jgi:hypothetical protein
MMDIRRIKTGPIAKFGNETPNKLNRPTSLSAVWPRRMAARTPSGTATRIEKITAATLSSIVAG